MFPIKEGLIQRDALSSLLFNFASGCATRRVQVNQNGLKLNGTHQLLVCVDDNGRKRTHYKKNAETLVFASKETGLEVNAYKTKYTVMSRDQKAG
jgi:hypothetical protein